MVDLGAVLTFAVAADVLVGLKPEELTMIEVRLFVAEGFVMLRFPDLLIFESFSALALLNIDFCDCLFESAAFNVWFPGDSGNSESRLWIMVS